MRRTTLLATALTLAIGSFAVPAQDLPDIGSSAGELLTPLEQTQYGQMLLSQLRHYGYTLEDPLLNGWLQQVGGRELRAERHGPADQVQHDEEGEQEGHDTMLLPVPERSLLPACENHRMSAVPPGSPDSPGPRGAEGRPQAARISSAADRWWRRPSRREAHQARPTRPTPSQATTPPRAIEPRKKPSQKPAAQPTTTPTAVTFHGSRP